MILRITQAFENIRITQDIRIFFLTHDILDKKEIRIVLGLKKLRNYLF